MDRTEQLRCERTQACTRLHVFKAGDILETFGNTWSEQRTTLCTQRTRRTVKLARSEVITGRVLPALMADGAHDLPHCVIGSSAALIETARVAGAQEALAAG